MLYEPVLPNVISLIYSQNSSSKNFDPSFVGINNQIIQRIKLVLEAAKRKTACLPVVVTVHIVGIEVQVPAPGVGATELRGRAPVTIIAQVVEAPIGVTEAPRKSCETV